MPFSKLGLSDKVQAAVAAAGYTSPTPIQEQAIPHVIAGRDVLGIAQTGTGKTAAFTLPMITRLENGRARARMPRTLILEPTRELAAQVEESFAKYGSKHKLTVALLIGGVSFENQETKLTRGVDVLIATPGRLLDHVERGRLLLTGIEILVIDEADRMLDMGFIPDIERICKLVPFTRQTLFFSATMPPEIARLTNTFLSNPARVEVSKPASTATNITQILIPAGSDPKQKREVLRGLIRDAENLQNGIIFCNRKTEVANLHRSLVKHGFPAVALHGDMDQHARLKALDAFRNGEMKLLVASDVAARGLDIPEVSHVFNFDVPHHAEDYVHRIGRTGRAGRAGASLTLAAPADRKSIAAIEKLIGQPITWAAKSAEAPAPAVSETPAQAETRAEGDAESHEARREHSHEHGGEHGEGRSKRRRGGRGRSKSQESHRDGPREASREAASSPKPAEAPRQSKAEPADTSHLPAFLLRPVRAKVS